MMKQRQSLLSFRKNRLLLFPFLILVIVTYALPQFLGLDPYGASDSLLAPSGTPHHILGTDDLGRDVLSRLISGGQTTLGAGLLVVFFSLIIGTLAGLSASVYGGIVRLSVNYFTDLIMSFPAILLAIVFLSILGPGFLTTVIAVSVIIIPGFVRVISAIASEEMKKDYIQAAHSFGMSRFRILHTELFPNCLSTMIVQSTFAFSEAILIISTLGFLHIGISPPTAEWGLMLADSYQFMEAQPYLVLFPGLCIFLTVLLSNLLGDSLVDWFNRRKEQEYL